MKKYVFILGASDPEMSAIKGLIAGAGFQWIQAMADGKPVHTGNAYKADPVDVGAIITETPPVAVLVECQPRYVIDSSCTHSQFPESVPTVVVDHHRPALMGVHCYATPDPAKGYWEEGDEAWKWIERPADPGYNQPPSSYWWASSIGQVWRLLYGQAETYCDPGPFWKEEYLLVAAADHCLAAAYRGECPGVDPDAVMRWRAESRAAYQKRSVQSVLADVDEARGIVRTAPIIYLSPCHGGIDDHEHRVYCGCSNEGVGDYPVADLRGPVIPELPEAAAREGIAVLAGPLIDPQGRKKIVLQAASPETISYWLHCQPDCWPPTIGEVVDRYGDPERGFAGGYLKE